MEKLLEYIKLQIQILQIQLRIKLLKEKLTVPNLAKPEGIVVHHGGGDWDFNHVNESHKTWKKKDGTTELGLLSSLGYYLGYQYWISYGGRRTQARRDNEEGAHTVGILPHYYNRTHVGIGCQGNTNLLDATPNQKMELKKLIDELKKKYNIPNNRIIAHREVAKTSCCGKYLFEWLVKNYPNQRPI